VGVSGSISGIVDRDNKGKERNRGEGIIDSIYGVGI